MRRAIRKNLVMVFSLVLACQLVVWAIQFKTDDENIQLDTTFTTPVFDESDIIAWKAVYAYADENNDGICDDLQRKIETMKDPQPVEEKPLTQEEIVHGMFTNHDATRVERDDDMLNLVFSFPTGDIEPVMALFEDRNGSISRHFDAAINGFSGIISIHDFLIPRTPASRVMEKRITQTYLSLARIVHY